jgi:hypothetical protein
MKSLPLEILHQIARTPRDGSNLPMARKLLLWMRLQHERAVKLPPAWYAKAGTAKAWWVVADLPNPSGKSESNVVQVAFVVVGFEYGRAMSTCPVTPVVHFACFWDGLPQTVRGWGVKEYGEQIVETEKYEAEEQVTYDAPDNGRPDKPKRK